MTLLTKLGISEEKIEKYLVELFLSDEDLKNHGSLKEPILDLIRSGGKRLRPALLITGAGFGRPLQNDDDVYKAAALAEAIHLSSLVHDDVIDNSMTRRSERSLNAKLGGRRAVLAGSYIFCRAVEVFFKEKDTNDHKLINNGMMAMCLGELRQIEGKFDIDIDVKGYLKKSAAKTAKLISACLLLGAYIAEADIKTLRILAKAGLEIGTAFQIVDDILDFTKKSDELGKPSGSDLLNGNVTLPVIYAKADILMKYPDVFEKRDKRTLLAAAQLAGSDMFINRCYKLCDRFLDKAKKRIELIEGFSEAKDKLYDIIGYIANRDH